MGKHEDDFYLHKRLKHNKWLLRYFVMRLRTLKIVTGTEYWTVRGKLDGQPTHACHWLQ